MAHTKRLWKHARMFGQSFHQTCQQVRHARHNDGRCDQVPCLPCKWNVDVTKCHTPARQNDGRCRQVPRLLRTVPRRHRATKGPQARHQSQPSAITATLATRNEGRCRQAPRMPRKTKVHVRHACHANCCGVTVRPRGPKRATRASTVP